MLMTHHVHASRQDRRPLCSTREYCELITEVYILLAALAGGQGTWGQQGASGLAIRP